MTPEISELIAQLKTVPTVEAAYAAMASTLKASPEHRVLNKFHGTELPAGQSDIAHPADCAIGVVLDTEATGKDSSVDKLIELGLVVFSYNRKTGQVLNVLQRSTFLQDPGIPIPPEATAVNGITDQMVKGHSIDQDLLQFLSDNVELVIAHSAQFDRPMVERELPLVPFDQLPWACSLKEVDWNGMGISSHKLEFIANQYGFFYDAHRAEMDCLALLHILSKEPLNQPGCGITNLKQLIDASHKKAVKIWAVGAPFAAKDALAANGYRWNPGTLPDSEKAWWKVVAEEDLPLELEWLHVNGYGGRSFTIPVDEETAFTRFSPRRSRLPRIIYGD